VSVDPKEKSDNIAGNECACGTPHYCEAEVTEIIDVLRTITYAKASDALKADDIMRKYDPFYYRRRMGQSEDASQARTKE
jgi:hypothetical protein